MAQSVLEGQLLLISCLQLNSQLNPSLDLFSLSLSLFVCSFGIREIALRGDTSCLGQRQASLHNPLHEKHGAHVMHGAQHEGDR